MRAHDLGDLADIPPLHFHVLTGDRSGQYAIRLTGKVRMVLTYPDPGTVMIERVVYYMARTRTAAPRLHSDTPIPPGEFLREHWRSSG